jgi:hypothetical protein
LWSKGTSHAGVHADCWLLHSCALPSLLLLLLLALLQYGTIDFAAVSAELPVERAADGTFLAIAGLPEQ